MTRNRAFRVVNGAFPDRKVMVRVQNEDKMNGGMECWSSAALGQNGVTLRRGDGVLD